MRSLESSACFTALQQQIGDQLRAAYGPLLEEELPQRFSELIERLQARMESLGENAASA